MVSYNNTPYNTSDLIVGLHVDLAYASSLARFAGSFGPVAWRVASLRIEQILPPGTKFGLGWVGDYKPLPTPVFILEKCNIKKKPASFNREHGRGIFLERGKSANKCTTSGSQIPSPAKESGEDSSSATAVSRAWMSIGAGGFRPVGENMGHPNQISSITPNQQPQISQFS
ncbi:hypothetical protein Leryth_026303 [Lithospermum erythrorhizon]|nr:hypothetical protein Leryth_026303 [Lithospermum erythrorhizon]